MLTLFYLRDGTSPNLLSVNFLPGPCSSADRPFSSCKMASFHMAKTFKPWRSNSTCFRVPVSSVRGTVVRKVVSEVKFKGYTHHATKDRTSVFHQER